MAIPLTLSSALSPPAVPVARAQDLATSGKGTITLDPSDPTIIIGNGTAFLKDFATPRCQIMLPRQLGNVSVEVTEVLEDGKLRIKKEFPKKAAEGWREKGDKGVTYKVSFRRISLSALIC